MPIEMKSKYFFGLAVLAVILAVGGYLFFHARGTIKNGNVGRRGGPAANAVPSVSFRQRYAAAIKSAYASQSAADSDNDGVSDSDEINVWRTDPLNPDTDGDGYADGYKILRGLNPLGPGKLP